jgi:ABC-type multidrug transport system ATPase subunit
MTSHVPDRAFLVCNRVALLKYGRLHGPGSPAEIITDKTLSDLYGTAMRVLHVQLPDDPRTNLSLCIPLMDGQEGVHDESDTMYRASVDLLESTNIPIIFLAWREPEDVKACMTLLGDIFRTPAAERYRRYFDDTLARIAAKVNPVPALSRPRVLYFHFDSASPKPHV